MHSIPNLLSRLPRALVPLVAGALGTALWLRFHLHFGLLQRFEGLTHDRVEMTEVQLVVVLWLMVAMAAALAPPALRTAGRRVPVPNLAWTAARPLSLEDRLAAATFGAYAANRAASVVPGAGIACRSFGPLIVALGGPAGDPPVAQRSQEAFRRWAGRRPVVWYGTGTGGRGSVRFGQEAIVWPARHDLASARLGNLRHSIARAQRAGAETVRGSWTELPVHLREQLPALEQAARRRHRLGLVLTVSRLADARDGRPWALAVQNGRVEAAVTWLPASREAGVVLDILWRRPDAVPGSVELLIEDGIAAARAAGVAWVSLGVCGDRHQPAWLNRLNPPGLRRFKDKFAPEWHDRYVVAPAVPRALALAAVALAHLAPSTPKAAS